MSGSLGVELFGVNVHVTLVVHDELDGLVHGLGVLHGLDALGVPLQTLLKLLAHNLTKAASGVLGEVVDTRRDGALVGEVARDAALDLGTGAADEGALVQETVLGGGALGLESAEEGLLGTENLEGGGGVLGEVRERAGVRDEAGGNGGAEDDLEVRSDLAHLLVERLGEDAAEVGHLGDVVGEILDHAEIHVADVLTHGDLGGLDDGLGLVLVLVEDVGEVIDRVVGQGLLVADSDDALGVGAVVGNDADELGEVPAVPLANAHGARVDTLVESIESGNALDDVVVVLVDGELDLGAGVGVTETELGAVDVTVLEALEELAGVGADAAKEGSDDLGGIGRLARDTGEGCADLTSEPLVDNTEDDLGLLSAGLGEVELERVLEVVGHDTLGDEVDGLKTVGGGAVRVGSVSLCGMAKSAIPQWFLPSSKNIIIPTSPPYHHHNLQPPPYTNPKHQSQNIGHLLPRVETAELHHLAKLVEILHGILDLGELQADSVSLVDDLEEGEADRALEQKIVDVGHLNCCCCR